jgi:hypothetical protein
MDTEKLLKAIQILIKEELKQQLPILVKETVKAEVKKILIEQKQNQKPQPQKSAGLSMAEAILNEDEIPKVKKHKEVKYSNNPALNAILNETKQTYNGAPEETEYRTMDFTQTNAAAGLSRMSLAEKMGYGDMVPGVKVDSTINGTPVNTAVPEVQGVLKALNRDYRELVKRF